MLGLDESYGDLRYAVRELKRVDYSEAGRAAAALVMRGVGFSDIYDLRNRASSRLLPIEKDEITGRVPMMGLNLTRVEDVGGAIYKDPRYAYCPDELQDVDVGGWVVGDLHLNRERRLGAVKLAGFREGPDDTLDEITLYSRVSVVIAATKRAIEAEVVSEEQIARVMAAAEPVQ